MDVALEMSVAIDVNGSRPEEEWHVPLGSTRIRRDDNAVPDVVKGITDVLDRRRLGVQLQVSLLSPLFQRRLRRLRWIVSDDRHPEKAGLTCQPGRQRSPGSAKRASPSSAVSYSLKTSPRPTHDDVVTSRRDQHVGDELGGDGRSGLVLLVLPSIEEVRDDGCDPLGRCDLLSVYVLARCPVWCVLPPFAICAAASRRFQVFALFLPALAFFDEAAPISLQSFRLCHVVSLRG